MSQNTLSLNRLQQHATNQRQAPAPPPAPVVAKEGSVELTMIPQFDPALKFIQVRDLARTNVRFQQGDNLFDKSKNYVDKADVAIPLRKSKPVDTVEVEKKVLVRDRGPRANGSSVTKILSVKQLKEQYATKQAKKLPSTPEAVLRAQRENRRAEAAEVNAA